MPLKNYRRRYRRKATSKKYTKNKAFVKAVSKVMDSRVEHKYKTYFEVGQSTDTGGQIWGPLTTIAQGTSDTERVGDQLTMKSIYVKMAIYPPSVSINKESNFVRVIAFQWKEVTNISGSIGPIPDDILSTPGAIDLIYCQYAHDNIGKKFTILYDKTFTITNSETGGQYSQKMINFRIPLKYAKRKVSYVGGSSGDAFNHFYLMTLSDSAVTNHPTVTFTARMHYIDA